MRRPWAHQPFANLRRCPPMNCFLLCVVIVAAIIAVFGLSSRGTLDPTSASAHDIYKNYRRLREQAVTEYLEIRALSQGSAQLKELDLCGKEVENHVPCYNVTANQLAGYRDGDEYDRHCEVAGVGSQCLVRPPKDYKIPLRWPAGRDVIWSGNVKLTKDQFLSSGSLTKRLMLLEENQIAFHSEDGINFGGVKDYSRQIAEMIGLGSDCEFLQAGEARNNMNREPSLRSVLSDPLSGAFLEDAMVVSCGHSFGGLMLRKVLETLRCSLCNSEIDRDALIPNHALRAAALAVRVEDDRRLFHNSALRKRRKEAGEQMDALKRLNKENGEVAADGDSPRQHKGVQYPFAVNEKVLIKGNRRTPDKFVGREAVITSQCLNGWYLLKILDSGESVRLQYRSLQKISTSQSDDRLQPQLMMQNGS